jgi:hypothetical protein
MKNTLKLFTLVLGSALLCAPAMAKQKAAKKPAAVAAPAMDPEMMKKWTEYSTPGDAHKALTPLVGSFTYTMKMWMAPNTTPEQSTGTTESQWILGGRFVESVVKGTSMGQPFEGRGFIGYDNEKKQYDSFWFDNMATGVMVGHGQLDGATNVLSQSATMSCPVEGTKTMRDVTRIVDANNHVDEMYTNDKDGKEFMTMQIVYTRKP